MNHVKITYVKPLKKSDNRKSVPKALKDRLWDTTFGPEAGQGECYVCGMTINSKRFEAGHIIAVHNGGSTTLENLKCICSTCNKSMGTQNLELFKKTYFPAIMKSKKKHNCSCGCHSPYNSPDTSPPISPISNKLEENPPSYNETITEKNIVFQKTSNTDEILLDDDEYEDYLRRELDKKLKFFDKFIYKPK